MKLALGAAYNLVMVEILKKQDKEILNSRYTYCVTDEMKAEVEQIKQQLQWDVNEMLRQYTAQLIEKAKEQLRAG